VTPQLADFGVVRTHGWVANGICAVTRQTVNHAVLAIGHGQLIEAQPHGAVIRPVDKYGDAVTWSTGLIPLTDEQRRGIAAWGRAREGTPYSYRNCAYIGFVDIFGWAPEFMRERLRSINDLMCSQLVDASYALGGNVHLFPDNRPAGDVSPGDLLEVIKSQPATAA
jgi:uncharacterized protein YycO